VSETALAMSNQEFVEAARRAQNGDKTALPALRELLKDPVTADRLGGDLAEHAQRTLVNKFSGQNLLFREAMTRKLELLRAELGGPRPVPLERLLVERVVSCWLHLYHLEQVYAQQDSMSLALGTYYQLCLDRAQKRYLSAIKTLALVRRLALPVLAAPAAVTAPPTAAAAPPKASHARPPTPAPAAAPALPAAVAGRLAGGPRAGEALRNGHAAAR
jgi:hypothetical protein